MFDRKEKPADTPRLLDRVLEGSFRRVAILGLHARAGTRTVLASLVREAHRREIPFAATSAPRLPLEQEIEIDPSGQPVTKIALPEGALVATAADVTSGGDTGLALVEKTHWQSPLGAVSVYRVTKGGEVDLHGPSDAAGMAAVIRRLAEDGERLVFVDGGWERRAFAAPNVTDGVILVAGSSFSPSPERSAAAIRYVVETLSVPPCKEPARVAWEETASHGAAALLDAQGKMAGVLPPGLEDPILALKTPLGDPVSAIVLPHGLNDEFMIPLVRSSLRCALVVKDPTRIRVAPIYFKAWLKGKGRVEAVRTIRIVAVATNPLNHVGPDADPAEFRQLVASALPDLPVHDVVLEAGGERRRPVWKFWE